MTDKNGKQIKTGDTVKVEGGFFKTDNGIFKVIHSPGDADWSGDYCHMRLLKKDGTISETTYNSGSWPIAVYTNSWQKRIEAKEHNKQHATIEIVEVTFTAPKPPQAGMKFLWNGIKIDGKLYPAYYYKDDYKGTATITVSIKGYKSLPQIKGLLIENDSDLQSDYFDSDRIKIKPGTQYYFEALTAFNAYEEHYKKRVAKRA